MLVGFLLCGFVGGRIGARYDLAAAQAMHESGELVDALPAITFTLLGACMGATFGTLTALVISSLVFRSRATKPPVTSEFE
jgi:hypothetical protein